MTMFVNMNGQVLTVSRKSSIKLFYKYFKATALLYRLFTTFTKWVSFTVEGLSHVI